MNAFPHFYYAPLGYFLSLIIYKLAREAEQLNNRHEPPGLHWLWCCHDNSAAVNPGCVQVPSETYWRSQMFTCCTVEDKLLLRVEWRTVSFKMEPFGLIWPYMEQQSFLVYFWWGGLRLIQKILITFHLAQMSSPMQTIQCFGILEKPSQI